MSQSSAPEPQDTLYEKHWIMSIGPTALDPRLALNHPRSGVMDLFPITHPLFPIPLSPFPISLGDGTRQASAARTWSQLL